MLNLSGIVILATISGRVVATEGREVDGGLLIVTDVTIQTDDGRVVTVTERGGHAGGFAQVSWPSPPIPAPDDLVTVQARGDFAEDITILAPGRIPFVRTTTGSGEALHWASGCVFMTYDADGTVDLAGDSEFALMDSILASWKDATSSCSYLNLESEGTATVAPAKQVGNDHVNRIVFRDEVWCRPANDGTGDCVALPSGAAGLTTVTYVDDDSSSRDGEIVDADIELNGEQFSISTGGSTLGGPNCMSDLGNTLTHELGHVMGLDHNCLAPGDPPKTDGDGNQVPLCSVTTDPAIVESTMYNFQECGETKKASPEQDDIDAVCDAYPREADPGSCDPVSAISPGCCSAGGGASAGGTLLISLLVAAGYRRRRSG